MAAPPPAASSNNAPSRIAIGTRKAFAQNRAYAYTRSTDEVYICDRGSEWSLPGEVLMLSKGLNGFWVAYDSSVVFEANGVAKVTPRQPCFRTKYNNTNVLEAGWHARVVNRAASLTGNHATIDWVGENAPEWLVETRVYE